MNGGGSLDLVARPCEHVEGGKLLDWCSDCRVAWLVVPVLDRSFLPPAKSQKHLFL